MTRLVFRRLPYDGGAVRLVFGADAAPEVPPVSVDISVVLGGPTVSVVCLYDNRLPMRVSTSASTRWGRGQAASGEPMQRWQAAAPASGEPVSPWTRGVPASGEPATSWQSAQGRAHEVRTDWTPGRAAARDTALLYVSGTPVAAGSAIRWEPGRAVLTQALVPYTRGLFVSLQIGADASSAAPHSVVVIAPWTRGRHEDTLRRLPWGMSVPVPPGFDAPPSPEEPPEPPREVSTRLVFTCPPGWLGDGPVRLVFGRVCTTPEPPAATVVVPTRRVYMITNTSTLRRVDTDVQLPALSTTLTTDYESWTWSFAADLPVSAAPLIARTNPWVPVEVELVINGQAFRAQIETIGRNRTSKDWRLTVRGRGLGAELDSPYSAVRTHSNSDARTAQQLANEALTINGVPLGWTVDWQLTDWLVPGDVWSVQGSPIAAVNAIAAAAGGYVQPHPTLKTLRVLPKFPVAPWLWGTVVPDIELPTGPVSTESVEWVDNADYNRVFVSGTTAGLIGQVTRFGTAGDVLSEPMVIDSLITHVDAARQRGIAELARGGHWANVSLRLPILQETGIILPGKMIRYDDGDTDLIGIARSLSVQDDGNEIWQSIGVASYVA